MDRDTLAWAANNSMQRTALRAAADAERSTDQIPDAGEKEPPMTTVNPAELEQAGWATAKIAECRAAVAAAWARFKPSS